MEVFFVIEVRKIMEVRFTSRKELLTIDSMETFIDFRWGSFHGSCVSFHTIGLYLIVHQFPYCPSSACYFYPQ